MTCGDAAAAACFPFLVDPFSFGAETRFRIKVRGVSPAGLLLLPFPLRAAEACALPLDRAAVGLGVLRVLRLLLLLPALPAAAFATFAALPLVVLAAFRLLDFCALDFLPALTGVCFTSLHRGSRGENLRRFEVTTHNTIGIPHVMKPGQTPSIMSNQGGSNDNEREDVPFVGEGGDAYALIVARGVAIAPTCDRYTRHWNTATPPHQTCLTGHRAASVLQRPRLLPFCGAEPAVRRVSNERGPAWTGLRRLSSNFEPQFDKFVKFRLESSMD